MTDELDTSTWDARIKSLYFYWLEKFRERGAFPSREMIDPLELKPLLQWLWLIDVVREPDVRFRARLIGTAHVVAMGRDITGQFLDEVFPEAADRVLMKDYLALADGAGPSDRYGPAVFLVPSYRTVERVMLPLSPDGKTVDMLLSITVYHDSLAF